MNPRMRPGAVLVSAVLALTGVAAGVGPVQAQPSRMQDQQRDRSHERYKERTHERERSRRRNDYILHRGRERRVMPEHVRRYRNVIIVRPYGHRYPGYGRYDSDALAYKWLAFTAITLALVNSMTVAQQRAYEEAQIRAASAPIGERILWSDGGASGSVVAVREGVSTGGRYCREFQQRVSIGGRTEQAYGTACRNPDGTWEVISTGNGP